MCPLLKICGYSDLVLPVRALFGLHNRGVSHLPYNRGPFHNYSSSEVIGVCSTAHVRCRDVAVRHVDVVKFHAVVLDGLAHDSWHRRGVRNSSFRHALRTPRRCMREGFISNRQTNPLDKKARSCELYSVIARMSA